MLQLAKILLEWTNKKSKSFTIRLNFSLWCLLNRLFTQFKLSGFTKAVLVMPSTVIY